MVGSLDPVGIDAGEVLDAIGVELQTQLGTGPKGFLMVNGAGEIVVFGLPAGAAEKLMRATSADPFWAAL